MSKNGGDVHVEGYSHPGEMVIVEEHHPGHQVVVVEHHGGSRGGHYINYCRHGDKWLCYDDTNIGVVDSDRVINEDSYIIFMTNKPHSLPWIKT